MVNENREGQHDQDVRNWINFGNGEELGGVSGNVMKWISPRYSWARLPCGAGGGSRDAGRYLVIAVEAREDEDGSRIGNNQIEKIGRAHV